MKYRPTQFFYLRRKKIGLSREKFIKHCLLVTNGELKITLHQIQKLEHPTKYKTCTMPMYKFELLCDVLGATPNDLFE